MLSGCAFSIAFLYKPQSGLDFLGPVLFILATGLYSYKRDRLWAEIIWPIALLSAGFLIPVIALAVYFFATGRLYDFIYWSFLRGFIFVGAEETAKPGWDGFVAVVTGKTWMIWLSSLLGAILVYHLSTLKRGYYVFFGQYWCWPLFL